MMIILTWTTGNYTTIILTRTSDIVTRSDNEDTTMDHGKTGYYTPLNLEDEGYPKYKEYDVGHLSIM